MLNTVCSVSQQGRGGGENKNPSCQFLFCMVLFTCAYFFLFTLCYADGLVLGGRAKKQAVLAEHALPCEIVIRSLLFVSKGGLSGPQTCIFCHCQPKTLLDPWEGAGWGCTCPRVHEGSWVQRAAPSPGGLPIAVLSVTFSFLKAEL